MDDNLIVRIMMIVAIIFIICIVLQIVKADKIKRKKYILGIIVFVCIWFIFFSVDFIRTKNQKSPIFCPFTLGSYINDGGSVMYYGLGYKVIHFNKLLTTEETYGYSGCANYYYICSWYPSYETVWNKIKDDVIKYINEQY